MSRVVAKFGGTSVADLERIRSVAARLRAEVEAGHEVAVVVSAMGGHTDQLVDWMDQIDAHDLAERDTVLAAGEQITAGLMAQALQQQGVKARSFLGWQLPIRTKGDHGVADIDHIHVRPIEEGFQEGRVIVVAGFQGVGPDQRITTLGRGGSDATAIALAAALKADRCDIYTDVTGVYTADPRLVFQARKLDQIGYEAMLLLAQEGAQVLQDRAVYLAQQSQVKLRVLSSFENQPGTFVGLSTGMQKGVIGLACKESDVMASLSMVGNGLSDPAYLTQARSVVSQNDAQVVLQNDHLIRFAVHSAQLNPMMNGLHRVFGLDAVTETTENQKVVAA